MSFLFFSFLKKNVFIFIFIFSFYERIPCGAIFSFEPKYDLSINY